MSDDISVVEKGSSDILEEKSLTSDALKQEGSLTTNAVHAVHAYDDAIVEKVNPAIVSDVRNINKEAGLGDHLLEWIAENYNLNVNKQELHIDSRKLENIYPNAANLIKFQIHKVLFKTEVAFEVLAETLHNFESIINMAGVNCEKIVNHYPGQLNIGDEFRFGIPLLENKPFIKYLLITNLPTSVSYKERLDLIDKLLTRRFDIRVLDVTFTTPSVDFAVQTLSNHPYAARRSWRLKMTSNPNEYIFETVEANSFPWLIDYFVEKYTGGRDSLVLWENFLTEVVRQNNGTVLDDTLIDGKKTTFYDNLKEILRNPVVQQALSEYPLIAEEVNRLNK